MNSSDKKNNDNINSDKKYSMRKKHVLYFLSQVLVDPGLEVARITVLIIEH